MNKIFSATVIAFLRWAFLANTSFAAPAAEKQLLLKGSKDTTETQEGAFLLIKVRSTGDGNATQLGLFTYYLKGDDNDGRS